MIGEVVAVIDQGVAGNTVEPHRHGFHRKVDYERVETGAAGHCPTSAEKDDPVVALTAIQPIIAARTPQEVIAGTTVEQVITSSTVELIIAGEPPYSIRTFSLRCRGELYLDKWIGLFKGIQSQRRWR
nr:MULTISPECIES: hypothetical protein [unclassified Ensifer]